MLKGSPTDHSINNVKSIVPINAEVIEVMKISGAETQVVEIKLLGKVKKKPIYRKTYW